MIERLLASEDFVDYWTYRWCDMLLINGKLLKPKAVKSYYEWIRNHGRQNTPWDEIVRELLRHVAGDSEPVIREHMLATPFMTLEQAQQLAEQQAAQGQPGAGGAPPPNIPGGLPGGMILPGG